MRPLPVIAALLLISWSASAQDGSPRQAARQAMAGYEYSKAIELLDKAAEGVADEAELKDIALQKARCQKKLLRYDAAAETLAGVMKPGMLDVEVAGELADCHVASGKLADALALYGILSMQHPDNLYFAIQKASLLFKVGDFQGCASQGKAICERDSIPSILSLVGASSLKMGQTDSALTYYRKSLNLNPSNPGTVTSISNILLSKKDYDGVIELTKGFLEEEDPGSLQIGQILGVAYYLKDDNDSAYEVFKQLRKDGDDSYGTMYYSGLNALALNRFGVAVECFGNAWQIDSSDAKLAASYAVALSKESIGAKNLKEAERMFQNALDLVEPDPGFLFKVHDGMARMYYKLRIFDKAIPHFKDALSLKPDYIAAYFNIGYCYQEKKDFKNALAYYEKYLSLDKRNNANTAFAKLAIRDLKSELHMQE